LTTTRTFEAIIFDHDGTLVDTETPDFLAWEMLYREYGAIITKEHWADVAVGHMNGYRQLFAELMAQNGNAELDSAGLRRHLEQFWALTLENVELMPGAAGLLSQLRQANYPLAVATASDRKWVTRWLTRFKLDPYFQIVTTMDDVVNNKPAPDVYLLAAERLGVSAERCLVFEDSLAGLQAAKAAGMRAVVIPSHVTASLDFSLADHIVSSLEHVTPAWIESLL
jgi:HAD superfamily hydrolase (TIGR01509 family)